MNAPTDTYTVQYDNVRLGILSVSDRASQGVYEDKGLPALKEWLARAVRNPITYVEKIIPDEAPLITQTLCDMVDVSHCDLVLTTGGTGPALRDVTPEATLAAGHKEMPGFGEQMRQISLKFVPTAILSRQVAVIRFRKDDPSRGESGNARGALIINLPGQPKSIAETLSGLPEQGNSPGINGIFAAVPYCIDLIDGPYIETDETVCKAFRPMSAIKIYYS